MISSTNPLNVSRRQRRPKGQRKNTCSKCGKEVETTRKNQRYCKSCHAANMRENRPVHSALEPEARLKANARAYANMYIRRGKLKKELCEICGELGQMHHDDYLKPLEVRWLCRKHHLEFHSVVGV